MVVERRQGSEIHAGEMLLSQFFCQHQDGFGGGHGKLRIERDDEGIGHSLGGQGL